MTTITLLNILRANVTIYNLSISNGHAFGTGGLVINGSVVNIYNSRFEHNTGDFWGGAISIVDEQYDTPSVVYIANSVFSQNQSRRGGGILGYKGAGKMTIECSILQNNHANFGGAISTFSDGTTIFSGQITIKRSNIINNTTTQYGGAAYRTHSSGWIEFDGNYWSPLPSNPLLPNPNTLYIVLVDDNPQNNPLPLDCEVPPPPSLSNSRECSARINPGATGNYRLRLTPGGMEILLIEPGKPIFIRGINANFSWYYIRYNNNEVDNLGWVSFGGVSDLDPACDIPLLGVNENNEVVEVDIVYDYDLQIPQPPWLPEIPIEERSLALWRTKGRGENDTTAEKWAYDHCLGIANDKEDWQNCTLIVYVVYYDIFTRINGRVPKLSDILATTYVVEVLPAVRQAGRELALEALTGNYFGVVRAYCEYLGIPPTQVDIPENCDNKNIPINDLVHGYKLSNTASEKEGGHLWTLQAWFKEGTSIRDWYFTLTDEQLEAINSLNGVSNSRLFNLLQAADENQAIGIAQLTEGKENSEFLKWANYAYGFEDENNINGYETALSKLENNTGEIRHCSMNLYFYGLTADLPGGEDVFVITEVYLGEPSTHDQSGAVVPPWVFEPYAQTAPFNSNGYLECPCLEDGQRYPDSRPGARRC